MSEFLQLSLALVILITAAKLGGYISLRLGQPSVLGEIIAGLALGPTLIDLFHRPPFTSHLLPEMLTLLAEMGVLFLMFLAGLELHLNDLLKSGKVAALSGSLGVLAPVVLGYALARLFGMAHFTSIFTGLVLAATSVSISAQTLMELRVLRSRVGIALLGAAVFDDVLVILGVSVFLAVIDGSGGLGSVLALVLRMVGFIAAAIAFGTFVLPRATHFVNRLPISQGLIAWTLVLLLLYSWAAEAVGGMAAITGAFLAGLFFARTTQHQRIEAGISVLAYGLLAPIFFVHVGLAANLRTLAGSGIWLALALTVIAVFSKVAGAGLGARSAGFTPRESLQLGRA